MFKVARITHKQTMCECSIYLKVEYFIPINMEIKQEILHLYFRMAPSHRWELPNEKRNGGRNHPSHIV